jgi:hypothetical protein
MVIRRVKAAFDEPLRSMVEVRNQARASLVRDEVQRAVRQEISRASANAAIAFDRHSMLGSASATRLR